MSLNTGNTNWFQGSCQFNLVIKIHQVLEICPGVTFVENREENYTEMFQYIFLEFFL